MGRSKRNRKPRKSRKRNFLVEEEDVIKEYPRKEGYDYETNTWKPVFEIQPFPVIRKNISPEELIKLGWHGSVD